MGKKKTQIEAQEIFNKYGYALIGEYKRNNIPTICEKNEYWYNVRLDNLQDNKQPSLWGKANYSNIEHNIKIYLTKHHFDGVYLGYRLVKKSNQTRLLFDFQCACGNKFSRTSDKLESNKYLKCNECVKHIRGKNHRKGTQKVIDFIESKGYRVLNKKQDYTANDLVEVMDEQGYLGYVKDSKLRCGRKMTRFDIRTNKTHYIENVNTWAKTNNLKVECLGFSHEQRYASSKSSVSYRQGLLFQCQCGNHFVTTLAAFQSGKTVCDNCSKIYSSYERIFKDFLDEENIDYVYQYSLNQCRDILPLPFDFYLSEYKVLVEIDGEGHYHPCNFNKISQEDAVKTFEITKKHDDIKNVFCAENNLKLLRIPYTMFQDGTYKNFFFQFIKE